MQTTIRVLLIEDNPDDAYLVKDALSTTDEYAFQVTVVDRLSTAMEMLLDTADYHVALLDLSLPDSQGIETFVDLYASRVHLPIIVMTGLRDDAMAARMFRLGAQGYLIKGVDDLALLPHAIRYGIEQYALREQARQFECLDRTTKALHGLLEHWPVAVGDAAGPIAIPPALEPVVALCREALWQHAHARHEDEETTALATAFIAAHASPREVIAVHLSAMQAAQDARVWTGNTLDADAYLLLVRVLCALLAHYQQRATTSA